MRRILGRVLENGATRRALRVLEHFDGGNPEFLRVLTYHSIEGAAGFRDQIRHLSDHYRPVSGSDVECALSGAEPLPPRAVLVTFDDAYCNFAEVAWPILREHGVPALLFVPTAYPDHPERHFWWDDLTHAIESTDRALISVDSPSASPVTLPLGSSEERRIAIRWLKARAHSLEPAEVFAWVEELRERLGVEAPEPRILGWDALRSLVSDGLEIGAHTRTHPFLDRLEGEQLVDEIDGSLADLEARLSRRPTTFAYPYGRFSAPVVEAARRSGLRLAFTTERGPVDLRSADPLRLHRIHLGPRVGVGVLQGRLLQCSARFGPRPSMPNQYTGPRLETQSQMPSV